MKKEQIFEMLMSAVSVEMGEQVAEPRPPYLLIPHNGDDIRFMRLTSSQVELFEWLREAGIIDTCDYELVALANGEIRWEEP